MSIKLKLMEIDNSVVTIFSTAYDNWANPLVQSEDFNSTVASTLKSLCVSLLNDMKNMGCHVIGKWQYNEETQSWVEISALSSLFHMKLQKYKPYVKVFGNEFAVASSQILRNHSGNTNFVSRSASEEQPITAAPISNAPSQTSSWDMGNPSEKRGAQTNQNYSNSETVNDPDIQIRVLNFNIDQLNLTTIANMIVRSVVEEYNTIY